MSRRTLALLAVVALVPALPADATDPVSELPWDLIECDFLYVPIQVPRIVIAPYLPPGFVPLGRNELVGVAVETDVCRSGAGLSGPVVGMTYASVWVAATPPQSLKRPGDGAYFVNFDVLVPDEDRRSVLSSTGIRAVHGTITPTYQNVGVAPAHVTLAMDGLGTIEIDIVGTPPAPGSFGGTFTQFTQGDDDLLVRWKTKWHTTTQGQGIATLQVPVDSWLAEVYGSPAVAGRAFYGRWSYVDGMIDGPLHNPAA